MENRTHAQYTCPSRFLGGLHLHPPASTVLEEHLNDHKWNKNSLVLDRASVRLMRTRYTHTTYETQMVQCRWICPHAFCALIWIYLHLRLILQTESVPFCCLFTFLIFLYVKWQGMADGKKPWQAERETQLKKEKALHLSTSNDTLFLALGTSGPAWLVCSEPCKAHSRSRRYSECWRQCEQTDKNVHFHGSDILVGRRTRNKWILHI